MIYHVYKGERHKINNQKIKDLNKVILVSYTGDFKTKNLKERQQKQ